MYDQFAVLYGSYRVDRVLVQLDIIPNPATSHALCALVQGPGGGWSINGRDLFSLYENPKCKVATALATAVVQQTVRYNFDLTKITGIGRLVYEADDKYAAAITANPANEIVLNLATAAFAGTSQTIQVVVTFVQDVTFWDPVVFGSS